MLVICGVAPLVLVPLVTTLVPESATILLRCGCPPERVLAVLARLAPGRALSVVDLAPPAPEDRRRGSGAEVIFRRFLATTLLIWLCSFIGLGVVFLIASYLPLLIDRNGFSASQTGLLVGLFGICVLVGQLIVSAALRRFDPRSVLAMLWFAGVVGAVLAGVARMGPAGFLTVVLVLGLALGGSNAILPALAYPASVRATGMSWANGVGQLGLVAGGLMIGAGWATTEIFLALALPVAAGIAAALALRADARRHARDKVAAKVAAA